MALNVKPTPTNAMSCRAAVLQVVGGALLLAGPQGAWRACPLHSESAQPFNRTDSCADASPCSCLQVDCLLQCACPPQSCTMPFSKIASELLKTPSSRGPEPQAALLHVCAGIRCSRRHAGPDAVALRDARRVAAPVSDAVQRPRRRQQAEGHGARA